MTPELEKKLVETYPKIFLYHGDKKSRYPIGWGITCGDGWYELINRLCHLAQHHIDSTADQRQYAEEHNKLVLDCRDGNFAGFDEKYKENLGKDYIVRMREAMSNGTEKLRDVPDVIKQVHAVQIKEKFGGLRFYAEGGDEYISGAIQFAELMSTVMCESCGDKGTVGTHGGTGWVYTACEKHNKRHLER